jgi:hypothetical protein
MGAAGVGHSARTLLANAKAWGAEGFFNAPPVLQSVLDGATGQPKLFLPSSHALRLPLEGERPIVSLVPALSRHGGPSDIARLVALGIVNTVQRVLVAGARAYFCNELGEVGESKSHTSPAVPLVVIRCRICATLLSRLPDSVFRGATLAVGSGLVAGNFTGEAATAFGAAAFQVACRYAIALSAAIAKAPIKGLPSPVSARPLDNEPAPEPLPGQVYRSAHQLIPSELVTGQELALAVPQLS